MRIEEGCIRSSVCVDGATVVTMTKDRPTEDNSTRTDDDDAERQEAYAGYTQLVEENVANVPR